MAELWTGMKKRTIAFIIICLLSALTSALVLMNILNFPFQTQYIEILVPSNGGFETALIDIVPSTQHMFTSELIGYIIAILLAGVVAYPLIKVIKPYLKPSPELKLYSMLSTVLLIIAFAGIGYRTGILFMYLFIIYGTPSSILYALLISPYPLILILAISITWTIYKQCPKTPSQNEQKTSKSP